VKTTWDVEDFGSAQKITTVQTNSSLRLSGLKCDDYLAATSVAHEFITYNDMMSSYVTYCTVNYRRFFSA
jgi:hypothetical protein